jgi:hypothetical protein
MVFNCGSVYAAPTKLKVDLTVIYIASLELFMVRLHIRVCVFIINKDKKIAAGPRLTVNSPTDHCTWYNLQVGDCN